MYLVALTPSLPPLSAPPLPVIMDCHIRYMNIVEFIYWHANQLPFKGYIR